MADAELETYAFNADISQLMSLIVNAFYSNKEIFLRELISNASDAMDKIQYQAVQSPEKLATQPNLYIKVSADREQRTVTVEDAGIGMTRDELITNLGTIAKSGTKAFMEAVSSGVDMSMIGQFGVGFYSAYLVSEKVRVVSKSNDDEQYVWESSAGGTFIVWKDETFEHGTLQRGTKVICYLKDDQQDFLDSTRLRDLILKHSAFVGFPIELFMEHCKEEDGDNGTEGEKVVTVTHSWELINKNKPVWMRPVGEVTHQEYADLYKWLANDWEEHLAVKHIIHSGQVEYKALLYCPKIAPKDMFDMGKMAQRFSIRLYVRRVFIKEFNDLIPKWMGFIKGIVDSDDMPLNISREQLQRNTILKHIQTGLQKSIFQMFQEMTADKEKYKAFHDAFSQCLKLGVYEDHANRAQIIPLLRYYSSKSGEGIVSLEEYCARMKPGQKHILYITGRTRRDAARSPYIEGLKRDGYEIIYMIDPVDEYAVQFLKEFNGYPLMSCTNMDAVRLLEHRTEDDKRAELEPVRKKLETCLSDAISATAFGEAMAPECCARAVPSGGALPTLELNPKHGLLRELLRLTEGSSDVEAQFQELAQLLLEVAQLDGSSQEDPRRDTVCARCQEMVHRLGLGDEGGSVEDLPPLGPGKEGLSALAQAALDLSAGLGGRSSGAADSKPVTLLSCGNAVRVLRGERARRAIITFVDEDAGTVDLMYPCPGGGEEEEEGVPKKLVHSLLDFELGSLVARASRDSAALVEGVYKMANAVKEEGNQLFKLKDFEAAAERYSVAIDAFGKQAKRGEQVLLVVKGEEGAREPEKLITATVRSIDAAGLLELSTGDEVSQEAVLPVFQELLPLQTSLHMNRARCRQSLGQHTAAAQDLSIVLGLWSAANKRMVEADPEMRDAEVKGLCTAAYLRARARLDRGLVRLAAQDVKDALARNPPPDKVKQLRQLKDEVQAAQEKQRQVNGPLAKELTKLSIALRPPPKIS